MEITELRPLVSNICVSLMGIDVVYLFGSRARGDKKCNDWDFAVLFSAQLNSAQVYLLMNKLEDALSPILGSVDIIDLNSGNRVLKGEVLRDKILIFSRNEEHRIEWEVDTRALVIDMKPYVDRYMDALYKRYGKEQEGYGK